MPSDANGTCRIPNLPFFYLVYRAWSHWRARSGGEHIQFLLKHNLLTYTPSPIVDNVYAAQKHPLPSTPEPTTKTEEIVAAPIPQTPKAPLPEGETMLLSQANGKIMTQALDLPQLEVELERAIWQVETAIKKQNEELAAKSRAASQPKADEASEKATGEEAKKKQ